MPMVAGHYYTAATESGDHIGDPPEDALSMLIGELNQPGNAFVTITPAGDSGWHASVSLLDDGTYEVERRDPRRREHDLSTAISVAMDLTIWLAARNYSGCPRAHRSEAS